MDMRRNISFQIKMQRSNHFNINNIVVAIAIISPSFDYIHVLVLNHKCLQEAFQHLSLHY